MNVPSGFGSEVVNWSPAATDDPHEVIAMYLQHRIVRAVRARADASSVRTVAARVGVSKSVVARWLSGREILGLEALGRLASAFGSEILASIAGLGEQADVLSLLPSAYRPFAVLGDDGRVSFADPSEPSWASLASAVGRHLTAAEEEGTVHLLSASVLTWWLAEAADRCPPTAGLVDCLDDTTLSFGLDDQVEVVVALVGDATVERMRSGIISGLLGPIRPAAADTRRVVMLAVGPRGQVVLNRLLGAGAISVISSVQIARAGLGNPLDPDLAVASLTGSAGGAGRVEFIEYIKGPVAI